MNKSMGCASCGGKSRRPMGQRGVPVQQPSRAPQGGTVQRGRDKIDGMRFGK